MTNHPNPNNAAQAAPQQTVLTREQIGELYKDWVCVFGVSTGSAELCIREIEAAVLSALRAPVADERAAFEASYRSRFNVPAHAGLTFPDVAEAWKWWQRRAALASAPVAGKAVGHVYSMEALVPGGRRVQHAKFNRCLPDGTFLYTGPRASAAPAAFSKDGVLFWYGDHAARRGFDGDLYLSPLASEAVRIVFPAHLRKMWSGGEVQAWLDEHQGGTAPKARSMKTLEDARDQARALHGFASPFRVGIQVVRLGVMCDNPYPAATRAWNSYEEGVAEGRKRADTDKKEM